MLSFLHNLNGPLLLALLFCGIVALTATWGMLLRSEGFLRAAIRMFPKNAGMHYWLGYHLATKSQDYQIAEKELRQAIKLQPDLREAYIRLADVLSNKTARYEGLEDLCHEMSRRFPNDPFAYLMLGYWHETQGRLPAAEQSYLKAVEFGPRLRDAYERLADMLFRQGRAVEAEQIYAEHRDIISRDSAAYYLSAAASLSEKGEDEAACDMTKRAIRKEPKNAYAHLELGLLLQQKLGRDEEAAQAYRKAIELSPGGKVSRQAYRGLGMVGYKLQRYAEAEQAYRKALEIDPQGAETYYQLGHLLNHALGRPAEAEEAFRKALEFFPGSPAIYLQLGLVLHEKLHRYEEAEQAYRKALDLGDRQPETLMQLGLLLLENMHRYAEAETLFKEILELRPNDDTALYDIACVRSLSNDTEEAFAYLRRAFEQGGDSAYAWDDPDLEPLRADPRFSEIVGERPKAVLKTEHAGKAETTPEQG